MQPAIDRNYNCKLYKKRWLILSIYVLNTVICVMHWLEYSVIADVIVEYYGVSYEAVDWNAMVYLLVYIVFSIPGSYVVEKMGLRFTVLLSAVGTSLGGWIKVASVDPDRYWVLMLGQVVVGAFQVFVLPIPSKVAALWFGEKEVPVITSFGVIAVQIGIAISMLLPPFLVPSGSRQEVQNRLTVMAYLFAILPTACIPVIYFFFDKSPSTPPSIAEAKKLESKDAFKIGTSIIKEALKNRPFLVFVLAYGMNLGAFYALSILLNQIVLTHHPDASKDVGIMGLVMTLIGIVGSSLSGFALSKFKKYKQTILICCFSCVAITMLFLCLLSKSLIAVYVLGILSFGFFYAIYSSGFEVGVELTYPIPEEISGAILTLTAQVFGIALTFLYAYLFRSVSELFANLVLCVFLLVVDTALVFMRFDLKRQAVEVKASEEVLWRNRPNTAL